jgi:hypothetical protein
MPWGTLQLRLRVACCGQAFALARGIGNRADIATTINAHDATIAAAGNTQSPQGQASGTAQCQSVIDIPLASASTLCPDTSEPISVR